MFTGIIEELGTVKKIGHKQGLTVIEIGAKETLAETKIGSSISVNGACLTVVSIGDNSFTFEAMEATVRNTNLGFLRIGEKVNLERSLKANDRLGGHFVSGHIDCLGLIRKKSLRNSSVEFEIAVLPSFMRYCLPKGSIALDGISLTLAKVSGNIFKVCVIPHTLKNTTLNFKGPSERLNVEFDMLAKSLKP